MITPLTGITERVAETEGGQAKETPIPAAANGSPWKCALELGSDRSVMAGGQEALCDAICRGADLRIYTEFRHEEHIAPCSPNPACRSSANDGCIQEVIDFRETLLINDRHAAGITLLRQPLEPTTGFNGAQPKLAFFLYNMDGQQACANLALDAFPATGKVGTRIIKPVSKEMPKMSAEEIFDLGTHGPSRNFIYEMDVYRFFVCDNWTEIFAHDPQGCATFGSFEAIEAAQSAGRELKVGIRDLCADLGSGPKHEVFSLLGSGILHQERRFYEVLTQPLVRVAAAVPMRYVSGNWDVSWVFLRTDGFACLRTLNPYTRTFRDRQIRLACRWFVR